MIVINYRALIQFACPGMEKQDILSGGRYPVYTEAFDDIFSKFRDYGAQLVFINDGPSTEIKNQCWREKRDVIYDRSINIFNDIDRKVPLSAIAMNKNIPHLKGIAEVFDPSKYGKFYKPCSGEPRNKVIASFAAKNKALAILSDDSDFLIYGGDWKFWSVYKINPELMTTREYSKANLRTTLKLDDKELSILATVMGNDYIKFTETLVQLQIL